MTSVLCPRCGEHWGLDELHVEALSRFEQRYGSYERLRLAEPDEAAMKYEQVFGHVSSEFRSVGCQVFMAGHNSVQIDCDAARAAQVAYELMGDDLDGAASIMEDEGL